MSSNLNKLVEDFQATGSQDSFSQIMRNGYTIATFLINKRYSNFGYFDDLMTEANDAIIRSLHSFDKTKGKFSTYCYKAINSAITTYIKKYPKKNQGVTFDHVDKCDPCFLLQAKEALNSLGSSHVKIVLDGTGSRFAKCRLRKKIEPQLISVRPIY